MAASFLGINMSGKNINVVNSSGSKIGTLYHKERFTYSFEYKTISGKRHKKIWFLNSSGKFGEGYILDSAPIANWMNYRFHNSTAGYHFKIDGKAQIYSPYGAPMDSLNTGCMVIPADDARTGDSMKQNLAIKKAYIPNGGGHFVRNLEGHFINTGVATSSTNTIVYGNWN
ncbi:hypothetical protein [Clostridium sp.]|uniref:hypothetical protein n=1 Tax=Clostridium sp. TaxID=1506 RepID=UPI0026DD166F|nr:hypothetical protein [Clostridium sp.]MDO5040117.1 hypothetical protein [Clostridium sp.]